MSANQAQNRQAIEQLVQSHRWENVHGLITKRKVIIQQFFNLSRDDPYNMTYIQEFNEATPDNKTLYCTISGSQTKYRIPDRKLAVRSGTDEGIPRVIVRAVSPREDFSKYDVSFTTSSGVDVPDFYDEPYPVENSEDEDAALQHENSAHEDAADEDAAHEDSADEDAAKPHVAQAAATTGQVAKADAAGEDAAINSGSEAETMGYTHKSSIDAPSSEDGNSEASNSEAGSPEDASTKAASTKAASQKATRWGRPSRKATQPKNKVSAPDSPPLATESVSLISPTSTTLARSSSASSSAAHPIAASPSAARSSAAHPSAALSSSSRSNEKRPSAKRPSASRSSASRTSAGRTSSEPNLLMTTEQHAGVTDRAIRRTASLSTRTDSLEVKQSSTLTEQPKSTTAKKRGAANKASDGAGPAKRGRPGRPKKNS